MPSIYMASTRLITRLWILRSTALSLTWAWATASAAVGLNALVKSNQLKTKIRHETPPPAVVVIDDHQMARVGTVLTSVCTALAVYCSLVALLHVRGPLSPGAFRFLGVLLLFFGLWVFAALVPYTHFFRTSGASITALIDGVPLPASIVQAASASLGLTGRYKDLHFLRLVAILPWFTVLFSLITAILFFIRTPKVDSGLDAVPNSPSTAEDEKA